MFDLYFIYYLFILSARLVVYLYPTPRRQCRINPHKINFLPLINIHRMAGSRVRFSLILIICITIMQMNGMGWKVEEHAVAEAAVTNEFIHGCNSKGLPPPSIGWRIGSPLCRSTEMHSRVTRGQVTVGVPSCDPTKHPIVNQNTQSIPITTDHRPTTTRLLQRR